MHTRSRTGVRALQVVVHGIPWSYDNAQLSALFTDYDPTYGIEAAEVIYGKDQRSRVRYLSISILGRVSACLYLLRARTAAKRHRMMSMQQHCSALTLHA